LFFKWTETGGADTTGAAGAIAGRCAGPHAQSGDWRCIGPTGAAAQRERRTDVRRRRIGIRQQHNRQHGKSTHVVHLVLVLRYGAAQCCTVPFTQSWSTFLFICCMPRASMRSVSCCAAVAASGGSRRLRSDARSPAVGRCHRNDALRVRRCELRVIG